MQAVQQPQIEHEIISAGVDWITGTNEGGHIAQMSDEFASNEFHRTLDRGERVTPESRMGYVGHAANHFFYGGKGSGRIMIASGARAHDLYRSVSSLSEHVSRLDVQVTIWTYGEQPHLGVQAYQTLKSGSPAHVRVRNSTLITSLPQGETCNVGKRSSDACGRIYDKATESKLGLARTVWRYEIEAKRVRASSILSALRSTESDRTLAQQIVHRWFSRRGVTPAFALAPSSRVREFSLEKKERDTLAWFRDSLSKTVAKLVAEVGEATVYEALGFSNLHQPNCERRHDHAARCRCYLPIHRDVEPVRADVPECALLPRQRE